MLLVKGTFAPAPTPTPSPMTTIITKRNNTPFDLNLDIIDSDHAPIVSLKKKSYILLPSLTIY